MSIRALTALLSDDDDDDGEGSAWVCTDTHSTLRVALGRRREACRGCWLPSAVKREGMLAISCCTSIRYPHLLTSACSFPSDSLARYTPFVPYTYSTSRQGRVSLPEQWSALSAWSPLPHSKVLAELSHKPVGRVWPAWR